MQQVRHPILSLSFSFFLHPERHPLTMPSRLASAGGGPGGPGLSSSASVASVAATQAAGGERALVLGDWTAAAELGLAALAGGGGGAAAQRGSCVAIQALFELGR